MYNRVMFELRAIDETEQSIIDKFVSDTCGCHNADYGPCSDVLANKFAI